MRLSIIARIKASKVSSVKPAPSASTRLIMVRKQTQNRWHTFFRHLMLTLVPMDELNP